MVAFLARHRNDAGAIAGRLVDMTAEDLSAAMTDLHRPKNLALLRCRKPSEFGLSRRVSTYGTVNAA
jgi:hypothetical protein